MHQQNSTFVVRWRGILGCLLFGLILCSSLASAQDWGDCPSGNTQLAKTKTSDAEYFLMTQNHRNAAELAKEAMGLCPLAIPPAMIFSMVMQELGYLTQAYDALAGVRAGFPREQRNAVQDAIDRFERSYAQLSLIVKDREGLFIELPVRVQLTPVSMVNDQARTAIAQVEKELRRSPSSEFEERFYWVPPGGLEVSVSVQGSNLPEEMKLQRRLECGNDGWCAVVKDKSWMAKPGEHERFSVAIDYVEKAPWWLIVVGLLGILPFRG